MIVSVIICSHNPRQDYLEKVFNALKEQSLPKDKWELLLIDNASKEPLSEKWDLSWHPNSRHILEQELGLTHARFRGIEAAKAELLVFVDDDNVLDSDYLEKVLNVSSNFPMLGVWGGSIKGVFEEAPPPYIKTRLSLLAIGEVESDSWGTIKGFNSACPPGAGMAIRTDVALKYQAMCQNDPSRCSLDRKGSALTSGGDIDMAWYACDIGYCMGRFRDLKMKHLIGSNRLTVEYFARLIEGACYSNVFLYHYHKMAQEFSPNTIWGKIRRLRNYIRMDVNERLCARAAERGHRTAILEIARSGIGYGKPT